MLLSLWLAVAETSERAQELTAWVTAITVSIGLVTTVAVGAKKYIVGQLMVQHRSLLNDLEKLLGVVEGLTRAVNGLTERVAKVEGRQWKIYQHLGVSNRDESDGLKVVIYDEDKTSLKIAQKVIEDSDLVSHIDTTSDMTKEIAGDVDVVFLDLTSYISAPDSLKEYVRSFGNEVTVIALIDDGDKTVSAGVDEITTVINKTVFLHKRATHFIDQVIEKSISDKYLAKVSSTDS